MTTLVDTPPSATAGPARLAVEAGAAPLGADTAPAATRAWRPLLRPAGAYLVSRLVVLATASVMALAHPGLRVASTLGSIWDGRWYLMIAQHGYPHYLANEGDGSRWAFFPAFPGAVRGLATLTRLSLPQAAALAAFVFGLTSTLAIWLAVREVFGDKLADRAVLLFVFCPTAYVLSLGYTEGLFLTAAAACLFALSRRYWITAALCACVAGLTRNAGVVVVLAVLVTALPAAWRGRAWRPAVAALLAPVGLASFMAYAWTTVGTPVAFLSAERFWHGQHFVWFTTPVVGFLAALGQGPGGATFTPDILAATALVLGCTGIWLLDRMRGRPLLTSSGVTGSISIPASWWVYTVGTVLIAYGAYYTDSIPRYTMAAFPLFVAFAWKLPARLTAPVVAVMAALQCGLLVAVLVIAVHPVAVPLVP